MSSRTVISSVRKSSVIAWVTSPLEVSSRMVRVAGMGGARGGWGWLTKDERGGDRGNVHPPFPFDRRFPAALGPWSPAWRDRLHGRSNGETADRTETADQAC